MKNACLWMLIFGLWFVRIAFGGEDIPLYYDPISGNVTIDVSAVDNFGSYVLSSPSENARFIPEGHTPFMGVTLFTSQTTMIGETNLATVPAGVYSLGEIMPPGLNDEQLQSYQDDHGNSLYASGIGRKDDSGKYIPGAFHPLVPIMGSSPFPVMNVPDPQLPPVDRWATTATLTYDASDGDLILDTTGVNGGNIFSYSLNFTDAVVDAKAFQSVGTRFPSVGSRQIVESGLSHGGIVEGQYNLGSVLPAGLMNDEFFGIVNVSRTRFVGEPGHTSAALDLDVSGSPLALAYVSEPTAFASLAPIVLLIIGSRYFVARRRNKLGDTRT